MNWSNEGYGIAMPPMNPMVRPLVPPMGIMLDNLNIPQMNPPATPMPLIGPMIPENMQIESEKSTAGQGQDQNDSPQYQKFRYRDRPDNRRDRDKESKITTDHVRPRSRSRERNDRLSKINDRYDRSRNDRNRNNDRKLKWNSIDKTVPTMGLQSQGMRMGNMNQDAMNMGIISGMMQYPTNNIMNNNILMNNMIAQQGMEGQHMMMQNINIMGNMMPNIIDQNMVMVNQHMMAPLIPNQPIYMNGGVLLPPIPGTAAPQRCECPEGCRTIFVGGLPTDISADTLNEMFQRFGTIQEIKSPRNGVCFVRFERQEGADNSLYLSGYRLRFHEQMESDAMPIFVDYSQNRDDQIEYENAQRKREPTPPRIEPFTPANLSSIAEKIKSEADFADAAPTLTGWLERGECNKKFSNQFYSLIQASNNQIRRLLTEKMQLEEDFSNTKMSFREKLAHVLNQFEQVAKILSAAKHQRVSDHFTKQQRKNIDMWLKMTEEVENIKEEFHSIFDDEEVERPNKKSVSLEKYEELKKENESLTFELEGYKNEAYLAKDEAERKFEKFKAHFIAQQALQNKSVFPPLPQRRGEPSLPSVTAKPMPPPPTPDDDKVVVSGSSVPPTEAKLISILTAFLMVHPLGASLDYLVSYVRSMTPNVTQATVLSILQKYTEIFSCKTTGIGACIEHRWYFVTFDVIKSEK